MNFSRNKVWMLPLLALILYPLWQPVVASFLAPRESRITIARKTVQTDDRNLHLTGITLSQSSGGRLDMELKAHSVATDGSAGGEYFFQEVDCKLYNDTGVPTLVKGGEAHYAVAKDLVTIIDDVVVAAGDGEFRATMDALRYFTRYKVAKTATPVHFKSATTEIYGNSMMYNLRTGVFRVGGGVICDM